MSDVSSGATSAAPTATSTESSQGSSESQNQNAVTGEHISKDSPTLTKAQKEKFMLKVDGEEFEEEIDFSDKETIKKKLQMAKAFEKRGGEAVKAKREAMELMKKFENEESFQNFLEQHPKGREIAEKMLLKQIQDQMMSPEEKERKEKDARLAKYEKEAQEREENTKKEAMAAKEAEYAQSF